MTTTADIITDALKPPAGADAARDVYSDALARASGRDPRMQQNPFGNAPKYPVEYNCQRFVMGQTMTTDAEGRKIFDETDDAKELAEIMQMSWKGEAIIAKRLETFLQDGTVVIWLEWLTPQEPPKTERPPHARTVGELLDPRVPPASAGPVPPEAKAPPANSAQGGDVLTPPGADVAFYGDTDEGYEDAPDF